VKCVLINGPEQNAYDGRAPRGTGKGDGSLNSFDPSVPNASIAKFCVGHSAEQCDSSTVY